LLSNKFSYNSALYSTTPANNYAVLTVTEGFAKNEAFNQTAADNWTYAKRYNWLFGSHFVNHFQDLAVSGQLLVLSRDDCLKAYSSDMTDSYSNVALVTQANNSALSGSLLSFDVHLSTPQSGHTSGVIDTFVAYGPAGWTDGSCTEISEGSCSDLVWPRDLSYCLSQTTIPVCTIQMSVTIMIMVVICNGFKIFCYLAALWKTDFSPLVTLGDAICSFLQQPDVDTQLLGPVGASDFYQKPTSARSLRLMKQDGAKRRNSSNVELIFDYSLIEDVDDLHSTQRFDHRPRWFTGASCRRWVVTYIVYVGI
jgi:hypothetical protein